jgi:hypothetical protein
VEGLTDAELLLRSRTQPELFLLLFERHYEAIGRTHPAHIPQLMPA